MSEVSAAMWCEEDEEEEAGKELGANNQVRCGGSAIPMTARARGGGACYKSLEMKQNGRTSWVSRRFQGFG